MTREALIALAERLEAAEGADRKLDTLIGATLNGTIGVPGVLGCCFPPVTASLDAAITLVPEGHVFTVADWWCYDGLDDKAPHFADCASREELNRDGPSEASPVIHVSHAQSKALALCAAALKARARAALLVEEKAS